MIDVTVTSTIERPAKAIAAFLFEPTNDPEWIGGLVRVEPPAVPLAPGVRTRRVAAFMGRRIDYVLEVDRIEPERLLAMHSVVAPFPMEVTYSLTPDEDTTQVSLRVAGGPGGLSRLVHPLMAWQVRRNLRADLRRLRACLEP